MTSLATWNQLSEPEARQILLRCCSSEAWAAALIRHRPFPDLDALVSAARRVWSSLSNEQWSAVIASHDRIADPAFDRLSPESRQEQSSIYAEDPARRSAIADLAARYEDKFGFLFIIDAHGRDLDEIADELERRLANTRKVERHIAVEQHQRIAERRLRTALPAEAALRSDIVAC